MLNKFNKPYKFSTSFKVFVFIFLLFIIGFLIFNILLGEEKKWSIFATFISLGIGFLIMLYLFFTKGIEIIINPSELPDSEKKYIDDLNNKLNNIALIKKYIFSNMDLRPIAAFIIAIGYIFKWAIFSISFSISLAIFFSLFSNSNRATLFDSLPVLLFLLIWYPDSEKPFLKKLNFKTIFILKILLSFLVFIFFIVL